MPVEKRGEAGRGPSREQLNRSRLALFLQQVEKEGRAAAAAALTHALTHALGTVLTLLKCSRS